MKPSPLLNFRTFSWPHTLSKSHLIPLPYLLKPLIHFLILFLCSFWAFCIYRISNIWSSVSNFLHLACFWDSSMLQHIYQYFVAFYDWVIFYWMDIPYFVNPVISWWTLRLLILLLWKRLLSKGRSLTRVFELQELFQGLLLRKENSHHW